MLENFVGRMRMQERKSKVCANLYDNGLSVKKDLPTGLNATKAVPSFLQACNKPISDERVDREYSDCTAAI